MGIVGRYFVKALIRKVLGKEKREIKELKALSLALLVNSRLTRVWLSVVSQVGEYPKWWGRLQEWRIISMVRCLTGAICLFILRRIGSWLRFKIGGGYIGEGDLAEVVVGINEIISYILLFYIIVNMVGVMIGYTVVIKGVYRKGKGNIEWRKVAWLTLRLGMGVLGIIVIIRGM